MSNHTTHCDDIDCLGCECTPECDFWDEEPNVLEERKRIIALLKDYIPKFYDLDPNSDEAKYPIESCIALIEGE